MSPDIQVKLLRALETRQVRRLGGKKEITVDIRIVAATNKDLQKALADGDLREDLYYRLAVVQVDLPPLRERAEDIQLLAKEFLERYASQNGKQIEDFDDAAWDWLLSYNWPGNVRELKNAVERAVILTRGPKITVADIMPRHLRNSAEVPKSLTIPVGSTTMADARRQLVLRTFASTGGDVPRAAKLLGVAVDDVRRELHAIIDGTPAPVAEPTFAEEPSENGAGDGDARAVRKPESSAPTRAAAKGKPTKKK
jgi:transcriptional regulator with PAS, ATPase and Fis domain